MWVFYLKRLARKQDDRPRYATCVMRGEVVLLLLYKYAGKWVKLLSLDQRCMFSHDVGFVRMPNPVSLFSWSLVDGHTGAALQRADRLTGG